MAAANIAGMASILSNMKMPDGVNPVVVNMPNPPALQGALRPNNWLTRAQAYALNLVQGPESLVVVNRYVYTGLKDGWVVEVRPNGAVRKILRMSIGTCGRPGAAEDACGRPLGVRADRQGYLLVADAYNGIFRVNPTTGNFRQLVDARNQMVNGKRLQYINDLAVTKDGTIFFTSSSTKWLPSRLLNILIEGETTGRVLVYNPREILAARRVQELVSNLHYPNGLQLSPDESFLLIGEGGRSRIHRAWIGHDSPKFGTIDTFAENLPGFVDNIRLSPRGTYWVGLSRARHQNLPSVLDMYGDKPRMRANLISLVNKNMVFDEPSFGIVVELDQDGKIVRSLQDPDGSKYTSVSEVAEENGILFIASKNKNFIGIIRLKDLPKVSPPDDPLIGTHIVNLSEIANPNLRALLTGVKKRLAKFSDQQVRSVVLVLVKKLYEAKMEARRALAEVTKLRADLERLQEMIGKSGAGSGPHSSQTTIAPRSAMTTTAPTSAEPSPQNQDTTRAADTTTTTTVKITTTDPAIVVAPDQIGGGAGVGGAVDGGIGSGGGGGEPTTTQPTSTTDSGVTTSAQTGTTTQAAGSGGTTALG